MRLSKQAVKEFQALYLKHIGKKIDFQTAEAEGLKLIRLVSLTQPRTMKNEYGNEDNGQDAPDTN